MACANGLASWPAVCIASHSINPVSTLLSPIKHQPHFHPLNQIIINLLNPIYVYVCWKDFLLYPYNNIIGAAQKSLPIQENPFLFLGRKKILPTYLLVDLRAPSYLGNGFWALYTLWLHSPVTYYLGSWEPQGNL